MVDELLTMVKCPNTTDTEEDRDDSRNDVDICGHGMVVVSKWKESDQLENKNDEGNLECIECGYELPLDYAHSAAEIVAKRAIAHIQDEGEDSYSGLTKGIEEGMGVLHPCHQSIRKMMEHLLYAAQGGGLLEVYAAQTLVNCFHAYLRHPKLHLHVALLHHLSGHALIKMVNTSQLPTQSAPEHSLDGPSLRLSLPSIFTARLQTERDNWPIIGAEYLSMSAHHLGLLLGRKHWMPRVALRCCVAFSDKPDDQCPLVRAYFTP